jgi:hypothetical protein
MISGSEKEDFEDILLYTISIGARGTIWAGQTVVRAVMTLLPI